MPQTLTLISHRLCPYVQRVAIVLAEKGLAFERKDVDLAHKPDWFRQVSPLGKTPVLLVDGQPIFESAAICEYLDDIALPRMHPREPIQRARHRAWMEFGSSVLSQIGAFYNAPDEAALHACAQALRFKFSQVEAALGEGPYFNGQHFCVVDAVFGPVFRYFDLFDRIADFGVFSDTPKVRAWRQHLQQRPSVRGAAHPDYLARLAQFVAERRSALSVLQDSANTSR